MNRTIKLRPPYSQVAILGPGSHIEVPDWIPGQPAVSTDSCILFACMSEIDGETSFTMGKREQVDPGKRPIWETYLKTPDFKVVLETVEGHRLIEMKTDRQQSKISIWSNRAKEPDDVTIGVE